MIMRAESWVTVSRTWPAKNTMAVSMIANSSAKNTGATSANSTAAEPRRLRRKRRSAFRAAAVEPAGDDIDQSLGEKQLAQALPETDCRSVSRNRCRMHRAVKRALTILATEFPADGCDSRRRRGAARSNRRHCGLDAAAPAAWPLS